MILKPTETIYGRLLNINVKDNYIIREWESHSVCVTWSQVCKAVISIRAPVLGMYVS